MHQICIGHAQVHCSNRSVYEILHVCLNMGNRTLQYFNFQYFDLVMIFDLFDHQNKHINGTYATMFTIRGFCDSPADQNYTCT